MVMTSAAEARLAADVEPAIAIVRSRSSYPVRRRPVSPAPGQAKGSQVLAAVAADAVLRAHEHRAGHPAGQRDVIQRAVSSSAASQEAACQEAARQEAARQHAASPLATAEDAAPLAFACPSAPDRPIGKPAGPAPIADSSPPAPAAARQFAVRRAGRPAAVRLTRRGRVVVAVLAIVTAAAVAAMIWLALAGQARASNQLVPGHAGASGMTRVVVGACQTLWGIALAAEPTADPRAVIQQIIDVNSLNCDQIHPGEILWVPRG